MAGRGNVTRREFVLRGLVGAVGVAVLAACGRPAATPSTEGGAAGKQVSLRLLTTESDPPSQKVYDAAVAEFTAQNPNIKIQMEYVGFDGLNEKIVTGLGAKKAPQMAQLVPEKANEYGRLGYLAPLDDLIAETGGVEKWQPTSLDGAIIDGKVHAAPYGGDGYRTLWTRTDLLEKNGLKPPTTWDEWKATAEQLTQDTNSDGTPDLYGVALPGAKGGWTLNNYVRFLWQTGETVFDKDFNVIFGKEGAVRALQFYKDMIQFGPPGFASYSFNETVDAFVSGQVATQPYAGRTLLRVHDNAKQFLEVTRGFKHPSGPIGGDVGVVNWDMYGVFNEKVGVSPAEQDAAKKFLKQLVVGKWATDFALTVPGHIIPPHLDTLKDPNLWNGHSLMTSHKKEIEWLYNTENSLYYVTEAGATITAEKVERGPVNPYWSPIGTAEIIPTMVQKVIVQNESPKSAVEWAATEMKRVVEDAKKKK